MKVMPNNSVIVILFLCAMPSSVTANEGWKMSGSHDGCTFYQGAAQNGLIPIRSVCNWDIPAEKLHKLISQPERFDEYFSNVSTSNRIAAPKNINRVLQVHDYPGMTKRAVYMDYTTEIIKGGKRYNYQKTSKQLNLPKDHIEVSEIKGFWQITSSPQGSKLVFETRYDAGGSIPKILIRWFQGAGTQKFISELKKFAISRKKKP